MTARPLTLAGAFVMLTCALAQAPPDAADPFAGAEEQAPARARAVLAWETELPDGALRAVLPLDDDAGPSILVAGDEGLRRVRADDGTLTWIRPDVPARGLQTAPPAVTKGVALAGWVGIDASGEPRFEVLSLGDGSTLFRIPTGERPTGPPTPLVSSSGSPPFWYLPVEARKVLVFDPRGKRVSESRFDAEVWPPLISIQERVLVPFGPEGRVAILGQGRRGRSPTIVNPSVTSVLGEWLVAADGREVACWRCRERRRATLSCSRRWRIRVGGDVTANPLQTREAVFVTSRDTFVHAFDRESGHLLWRTSTGSRLARPAVVWDDLIAVPAAETAAIFFLARSSGARAGTIGGSRSEALAADPVRAGDVLVLPLLVSPSNQLKLRAYRIERIDPDDES